MKVYHSDGRVYEGEPVDCRELMQLGGFVKEPPTGSVAVEKAAEVKKAEPTQSALDDELAALPKQVGSGLGQYKDVEPVVASLKSRFKELFTADNEASVRALFPSAGKAADATAGKSAKVSGRG